MEAGTGVDSGGQQAVARHGASPTSSPRTSPWAMVEPGTTPPQGSSSPTQHLHAQGGRATAALGSSVPLSSSPPITGSPLMSVDKNNSAEQVQLRAYWLSFIKTAGIDKEYSVFYASIFLENELDGTMLGDIDHSLLVSLGVKKAGHRIKIIRFARLKLAAKKNPSLIPAALHSGKSDKVTTTPPRERHWMAEDKDGKKKRSNSTANTSAPMRRARSNSKENLKRSEVQKAPGTSPLPRREGAPTTTAALEVPATGGPQGPSSNEASPLVAKRDHHREQEHHHHQEQQQQPPQSEEDEEEDSESESTLSDSSDSDSEADLDFDFAEEEETAKMFAAIRSRYRKDPSKEKLPGAKSKKTDSSKNLATSSSGTKDDPPVRTGSFTGVRTDEEALNDYDMELADEHTDLSQYHEIKFFFNLEPTKRYLESTKEITGREFTEMACQNLNKEPGSIVVFTVNDNGEFVPLKEDDYIIRSEMHYVIESRKVSKDIKKLKERLKKEKPVWDSDNWPLMVDFVDSKDIYMAEHGRIGLCMCPGRKKKKKRHVWARDQYKDLDRLQQVYSCDVLVTLVREQELRDLRIEDLFDEVKKRGMQSLYLPIKDKWIPKSTHRLIDLVEKILSFLRKGKTVVVHCNGGKGRSATVIVACLIALGQSIPHAIKILQRVRKGTIRNPLQQAYLRKFLSEWTAAQKTKQRKKSIIALTASSVARERNTLRAELSEAGELPAPPIKDGEDGELGAQDDEGIPQADADSVAAGMQLISAPSPGSSHGHVATFSSEFGDVTQGDAQPAPPSSEGEEDRGTDRIRADTADFAQDERNEMLLSSAGEDALGLSDDASSGTVPTVPHLTPLEKKLMKVQKLIKKTEKRIVKKESMITKEKHHLDDLRAELKRVSAELKKEMQEGGRSGSFIKPGKSDKLAKSAGPSGARSPGPVRRGDGIDERDAKDRGREREDKEKERKERKEKKEKEKEGRRKEREEKERERREKEREKREKGREERERKEKEKEERKEKKKEEKLLNKRKIETSGGSSNKLRSREGSNADLSAIDYVAAASAALEAAELPLPSTLVERPLSNTTSATVVAVDATKEQETDKTETKKEKDKEKADDGDDEGDDGGDDDDGDDDNLVVDVQSVGASTASLAALPVVEEPTDSANNTANDTTSAPATASATAS